MKRLGKRILSGIFALIMITGLLCTAASAAVQSSAYLDGYRVGITPKSGGKFVITVDVTGVDYMPEIGAKEIYVYESTNGTDFYWIKTYRSEDYPKMMGSGYIFYEDVLSFQGVVGRYYYATACVYAGDSSGGDERYCDTAIKLAQSYVPGT